MTDMVLDPDSVDTVAIDAARIRAGRLLHAQCVVLGCLMDEPSTIDRLGGIARRDFPEPWYGRLFEHLCTRIEAGEPVDVVELRASLPAEWLAAGGGPDTLSRVYLSASPSLLPVAVRLLREHAAERRVGAALDEARTLLEADEPIAQRLDRIVTLLGTLERQQATRKGPQRLADLVADRVRHYEDLQAGRVKAGMGLGIPTLDAMLGGGLRPGAVYVLAARPGIGKSSLAQQFALHVARRGHTSLILSQEMPAGEVADRAIAHLGGIDYGDLARGKAGDIWGGVVDAQERVRDLQAWVDDEEALTLAKVRQKARAVPGLQVLVVDYLQLMQGGGKTEANRNAEIEVISRGMKALAKQLGIAVVLLSQLNRQVENRPGRRPAASDLRDSGSIEQDADVVLLMWQHWEHPSGFRVIGMRVDKNRQGRKGEVALRFDGSRQRWGESTEPLDFQPARPAHHEGSDL